MYKKILVLITITIFILFLFSTNPFGVTTYRGIDVSHYQGTINWSQVAADGVEFAIIKATEGNTFTDPMFKENATNAYNSGIAVGAYHLARFTSVEDAMAEADFFLRTIQEVNINYAVALDLEFTEGLDPSTLTTAAGVFLQRLQNAGYTPLLYSYQYFFLTNIRYEYLEMFNFWVAKFSSNPPTIPHVIWQYTSTGSVNGIFGNVDMNIAYADLRTDKTKPEDGVNQNNTTTNEISNEIANEVTNEISNDVTNEATNGITNETTNNIVNNTTSNSITNNTNNDNNTNTSIIGEISESSLKSALIAFFVILFAIMIIICIILIVADHYIK